MMRVTWMIALLLLSGAVLMGPAQIQSLDIDKQETSISVSWVMQSEEGVERYVVTRKTSFQADFEPVKSGEVTQLQGPGFEYVVMDRDLYKNAMEEVQYRLEVYGPNDNLLMAPTKSTTYQPTAVRRTWGSIKAMFQ